MTQLLSSVLKLGRDSGLNGISIHHFLGCSFLPDAAGPDYGHLLFQPAVMGMEFPKQCPPNNGLFKAMETTEGTYVSTVIVHTDDRAKTLLVKVLEG